jgi:hypothetical protein
MRGGIIMHYEMSIQEESATITLHKKVARAPSIKSTKLKVVEDDVNRGINDMSNIDGSLWETGLRTLVNDFQMKQFSDFSHFRKC